MTLQSFNPVTEEALEEYSEMSSGELNRLLEKSKRTFQKWRDTSWGERIKVLKKLSVELKEQKSFLAQKMTEEMGKPIAQAEAEIEKCARVCDHYADTAPSNLEPETVVTEARKSFVCYEALGPLLAIMPWNFPFWQVFRVAAPNIMLGNPILLKHASNVFGCAEAIEALFQKVEPRYDLLLSLRAREESVSWMIQDSRVRAVTLTGSTRAGRAVAQQAGQALKKVVLELGGSDPYIVLSDADIESAVETCVASRMINSGQSCVSAKRFIVDQKIHDHFLELFVQKMQEFVPGDPMNHASRLGPLARSDLRETLHQQLSKSLEKGAKLQCGGIMGTGKGYFYPASVLSSVQKGMPAFDEELFGPVAAVVLARDEREAIQLANDSPYGLGAAIFSKDLEKAESLARRQIEAGCVFINDFVKSDPRLPFGGVKESGFGRELGLYGLREFANIKTVVSA